MTIRIILFILAVAAMAAFGLFTQASAADQVIVNNYTQPAPRFCWGLMCLIAPSIWAEEDRRRAYAPYEPHQCHVWNGSAWVTAMCSP
jgi:hypothetical protein